MKQVIAFTLITFLVLTAGGIASAQKSADSQSTIESRKVTVNLKDAPVRDAIATLFAGTGAQYTIDPNVPNVPITLNIRDIGPLSALRLLIRQAAVSVPGLTFGKDGDVYVIKIRRTAPPTAPDEHNTETPVLRLEEFQLRYAAADDVIRKLREALPSGTPSLAAGNTVLLEGSDTELEAARQVLRLLDVPTRELELEATVTGPGVGGRPIRMHSSARGMNGQEITMDEEATANGVPARLHLRARPDVQGDRTILVHCAWDISIPVAGGSSGPVRLRKQLTTDVRLAPGTASMIAEVDAASWGGEGKLRLWLKAGRNSK